MKNRASDRIKIKSVLESFKQKKKQKNKTKQNQKEKKIQSFKKEGKKSAIGLGLTKIH